MPRYSSILFLILLSGCDWFHRPGPPAQQRFERAEPYAQHFEPGVYRCTKCGAPLFRSEKKIHSGARWPVFSAAEPGGLRPPATILTSEDRAKVVCAHCGLQVGQLCRGGKLLTGDEPTSGADLCAMSSALKFEPKTP